MNKVIFIGFFVLILNSCAFDAFDEIDYFIPEVTIQKIEQVGDTTMLYIMIPEQPDPVDVIGVSYKENEIPRIENNQIRFQGATGEFIIPVVDLEPETIYYFLVFAGNDYALGESEIISFTIPRREADVVPCDVNENVFRFFHNRTVDYSHAGVFRDIYKVSGAATSMDFEVLFTEAPTTAIYNIDNNIYTARDSRAVKVGVTSGQYYTFQEGQSVYVEKIDEDKYSITFCDLLSPQGYSFSGNFTMN